MSVPQDGDVKVVQLTSMYDFNPELGCGECLNGTTLEYKVEVEGKERHIQNAEVGVDARMSLNGKARDVRMVYTINRFENIAFGNKVKDGRTWGTFEIYRKLDDYHGGPIIKGSFLGEIFLNKTTIKLSGKGFEEYAGYSFKAKEQMVCTNANGKLHCWKSNTNGILIKEEVKF